MPIVTRSEMMPGLLLGIYGIPGIGKTSLAAALALLLYERTKKPVLYADWENGATAIPSFVPIELWQPDPNADPLDEAQEVLEIAKRDAYSGLINDTISTMAERFLRSVVSKGKGGLVLSTKAGKLVQGAAISDYGMAQLAFQQWSTGHTALLQAGKSVLWAAHERLVEVKQADMVVGTYGGPEIIGTQLTLNAPKLMQVVIRMTARKMGLNVERILEVESDGLYIAKDRYHCLPQRGTKISVRTAILDDKGKEVGQKSPEEFEREVLLIGMKVWRTIFKAAEELRKPIYTPVTQPPMGN